MPEFQWLAAAFPNFVRYVVVGFALAGFFLLLRPDHDVARVR